MVEILTFDVSAVNAINTLEKIKKEPGMTSTQIMAKFTKWERDEIYPPLTPLNVPLMLGELAQVGYIKLRQGKAYPKEA